MKWVETRKLMNILDIEVGMKYLHLHDIIQGDLKPFNICLDKNFLLKISGFSISITQQTLSYIYSYLILKETKYCSRFVKFSHIRKSF